jgi:hypothetical protein
MGGIDEAMTIHCTHCASALAHGVFRLIPHNALEFNKGDRTYVIKIHYEVICFHCENKKKEEAKK